MIVATSICANYIPKAKVLAASLKKHNPDVVFVLCLVERTAHPEATSMFFDEVVLAGELNIPDFESFMFRYSIVEASTAVKGHLFQELFRRFPQESVFVYLDPDILVTGPLTELREELKKHTIILTPHLCEPEVDLGAIWDNEVCALKHGVFNLGFLAIRRSEESVRFVDWWASRLYELCYADIPAGLFTDQRWIDLAPCFFDVFVFRHPGYNAAPWNLSRRKITENEKGEFMSNSMPLRFFHFSGFDSGANELMVLKYCPDRESPLYKIRDAYIKMCAENGQRELGLLPWSFNLYANGKKIENRDRLAYRSDRELRRRIKKPFEAWKELVVLSNDVNPEPCALTHVKNAYHEGGIRQVITKTVSYLGRLIGLSS